ncbi:hypothetical protein [Methylobacterium flocculans]|uniref:hypothetical protein n=1 Tax=Methylobacterium flocculans TaxID=2984843 RepID=UPI0021F39E38|nr:hypothetical protein [Methylobacterium sp. FF17]
MLINTTAGIINSDHIVRVLPNDAPAGRQSSSTVTFSDGSEKTLRVDLDTFESACGVIITAQPGFTLVQCYFPSGDDEETFYDENAVIAFRICGDGEDPRPITLEGEPSSYALGGVFTVMQPNGRCHGPEGSNDTLDSFKAMCAEMIEKRRAERRQARASAGEPA